MADEKIQRHVSGVIPFNPEEQEEWGGGRKFPPGKYTLRCDSFSITNKGKSIAFNMYTLKGPDDSESMKGQTFNHYFQNDKSGKNFMMGFFAKVCPEIMEPANLKKGPKGTGVDFDFLSGGAAGTGIIFEGDLFEEAYKDKKTGDTKVNTKMDHGSVKLITPSSKMAANAAAGDEGEGTSDMWAPAE